MTVRLLVTGADGQLGREFAGLSVTGVECVRCARRELDITDPASIRTTLEQYRPQAIINAAAYTAVDRAESEREQAFAINTTGPGLLAQAAEAAGIPLLHVSTDYVFSGDKPVGEAWRETDPCEPRSVYGQSKLAGERAVLAACSRAVVLRTSWVFGRYGNNFPKTMLRLAADRDELRVVGDQHGCPTHAADIAITLLAAVRAMVDGRLAAGIYHYAGSPSCTWHALAGEVLQRAVARGLLARKPLIHAIATHEYPVAAPRPMNSVLCCDKLADALGIVPSDWKAGIDVLLDEISALAY